jgi:hypothetical protein
MAESLHRRTLINEEDLLRSAHIAETRFPDAELETMRTLSARRLLETAFALEHALRAHTRCMLVNHCGTIGSNNLAEATEVLFDAFNAYTASIRELADRFRNEELHGPLQSERVNLKAV